MMIFITQGVPGIDPPTPHENDGAQNRLLFLISTTMEDIKEKQSYI